MLRQFPPLVMPTKVVLILGESETTPQTKQMVKAMQDAIMRFPLASTSSTVLTATPSQMPLEDALYCVLTLDLGSFGFSGQTLFQLCQDVPQLRQQVQEFGYPVGAGDYYLPVVHTAKGSLYGEVIGQNADTGQYQQPVSLPDAQRQPLYHFAHRLLTHLNAFPSVYLVQFGWEDRKLVFDRLYPFPTEVALGSLGVQHPNLFECYWRCLTGQPILDLTVFP
jgi:hypothetical protein